MVENISNMVLNSERSLLRKVQVFDNQTSLYLPIRVISTYHGSDNDLVSMTKNLRSIKNTSQEQGVSVEVTLLKHPK